MAIDQSPDLKAKDRLLITSAMKFLFSVIKDHEMPEMIGWMQLACGNYEFGNANRKEKLLADFTDGYPKKDSVNMNGFFEAIDVGNLDKFLAIGKKIVSVYKSA